MAKDPNQKNPFLHVLKSYDEAIGHYEFVIQDLSSEIYDPSLENAKLPVIQFLKQMQEQWKLCREDVAKQIKQM